MSAITMPSARAEGSPDTWRNNISDRIVQGGHAPCRIVDDGRDERAGPASRRLRVVLYSHDTMGLGHIRRNLLIAQALSASHLNPDVLLVTGAREAGSFSMPPGVDCLILPSLYKESNGRYRSRRLRVSLQELISVRKSVLQASIRAFDPDVFIVDNTPRGVAGELDSTLELLRARGRTRCVLGLRDIRDEPEVVAREWRLQRSEEAIRRYYEKIWVYGDAAVYDPVKEYRYPSDMAAKVSYTGYLDQRVRLEAAEKAPGALSWALPGVPKGRFALCLVGGGQDGGRLVETFAQSSFPAGMSGVIVTGPHLDAEVQQRLIARASQNPQLQVLGFVTEPTALLRSADCVVAMGGYNTTCEILSFGKRALIVPRVAPRKEQLIRAQRLQGLGVLDMVHPDKLSVPFLDAWLQSNAGRWPPENARDRIDMNGLSRMPQLLTELLHGKSAEALIQ